MIPVTSEPPHGSVVTYRYMVKGKRTNRFRIGGIIGPLLVEPETGKLWVGVRLPPSDGKQPTDLISVESIVDIRTPAR